MTPKQFANINDVILEKAKSDSIVPIRNLK
jgi:hypothetical protein